jgi:D-arabinose 1-dehydrogenase-like Zn-dependent alcohol dehydrogenase
MEMLAKSAIGGTVARERGVFSVESKSELGQLGFGRSLQIVPTLVCPIYGVIPGEDPWYVHRPDVTPIKDGRPREYLIPAGRKISLDIHSRVHSGLADPAWRCSSPRAKRRSTISDVVVQVHASGFTSGLAEYVAIEARNLAPLPGDVDFTVGASLPMPGLTAWQGPFEHGRLQAGQSVLVHGAAGAVGSMVTQLAREFGAYVIGTGRAADRQKALDFGAAEFVALDNDALEDVCGVDLVFDVIGGDIQKRSAGVIPAGGTPVNIAGPPEARPADGLAIDFVVLPDHAQLGEIVQRVRDGRLRTNIGKVATLDDAVAAFNPTERISGQTIIRVRP